MEDVKIVELYFDRDEQAIRETDRKYGPYLTKIAYHILTDAEDSRESVNDAYMGAWSSIPPQRPTVLRTYLVKLTRRIAIGVYLKTQPERTRRAFIGRYFYMDSLREVARYCGMSEGALKSLLHRTRRGLRDYLIKEGFDL